MPDTFDLVVDTRELDAKLADLPNKLRRNILTKALQVGGDVLLGAVVEQTPERTDDDETGSQSTALGPGILRADMHTEIQFSRKHNTARVKVGPSRLIGGLVAYRVNNGFLHKSRSGKIEQVQGQFFLERAFDESSDAAVNAFLETLGDLLLFEMESATAEDRSFDVEFD